jgi:hypothetical protein
METSSNKDKRSRQAERKRQASRLRRVLWAVVGVLGMFVAWLVISNPLPSTGDIVRVAAEPAPDITLVTNQGDYRLSEQKGEVVALYFSFVG